MIKLCERPDWPAWGRYGLLDHLGAAGGRLDNLAGAGWRPDWPIKTQQFGDE